MKSSIIYSAARRIISFFVAVSAGAVPLFSQSGFADSAATKNMLYYHAPLASVKSSGVIRECDVCIYGGTAGGIIAAVEASRRGLRVIVLDPAPQIGGMTASGLGYTDIGNKAAIGGLARDFYRRMGKHYGVSEAWTFEPSAAAKIFAEYVRESGIQVLSREFLASVKMEGKRIVTITMESGATIKACVFIDTTYEGDLLARAGVSYHVGREDNATYGETLNGAQVGKKHQFDFAVSPYIKAGDASSGLLPGIETTMPVIGQGDRRVQAYNFRVCMTDNPANRIPFPKPAGYDRTNYVLLERYLNAGWRSMFGKFDRLRVRSKPDTNNHGAISSDYIGQSDRWAEASYEEREKIFQAHVAYQQGLYWFYANDPAVPADVQEKYRKWGLCRDEFTATGGWPHQLYVREARRMVSDYVMTEQNCRGTRVAPDPVGLAAYTMDSHNCRRFVDSSGNVRNEGDVQVHGGKPYPISYRSIVPRESECENLLVPACLSASHIAYGSIRMEPVFMSLGQAAAIAAHLSISGSAQIAVQKIPYGALSSELRKSGVILEWAPDGKITPANMTE